MEDTQIIALYWQRSSDAIRASEEAYGAYCFTVANRIVDNREDAEECVSDTWLRAWYAMPPEKPNYLRMFFAAITRNLSLDRMRATLTAKRGGGQAVLALEELSECVSGSPEVEDAIIAAELSASVNRFLNTLSEPARNVFLRRYFFLESAAEIAERYAMKPGAVAVSLHRTRAALREHLRREGFFDE